MSQQTANYNPAETHTEIVHEHTLFAEPIFHLGNFTVTNSLFNSWLVVLIVLVISLFLKSRIKMIPRGFQNVMEMIVEWFLGVFDSVTSSR